MMLFRVLAPLIFFPRRHQTLECTSYISNCTFMFILTNTQINTFAEIVPLSTNVFPTVSIRQQHFWVIISFSSSSDVCNHCFFILHYITHSSSWFTHQSCWTEKAWFCSKIWFGAWLQLRAVSTSICHKSTGCCSGIITYQEEDYVTWMHFSTFLLLLAYTSNTANAGINVFYSRCCYLVYYRRAATENSSWDLVLAGKKTWNIVICVCVEALSCEMPLELKWILRELRVWV